MMAPRRAATSCEGTCSTLSKAPARDAVPLSSPRADDRTASETAGKRVAISARTASGSAVQRARVK